MAQGLWIASWRCWGRSGCGFGDPQLSVWYRSIFVISLRSVLFCFFFFIFSSSSVVLQQRVYVEVSERETVDQIRFAEVDVGASGRAEALFSYFRVYCLAVSGWPCRRQCSGHLKGSSARTFLFFILCIYLLRETERDIKKLNKFKKTLVFVFL